MAADLVAPELLGVPRILLVIGGGIAAYKSCELVRLIRRHGGRVTCVITEGGQQFVTPMALAALSENPVYTSLWDLRNEAEMGHIQLSREADLVVVCPATADLLAKMAAGIADDLATTLLLATDKPVMVVPAMNVRMWLHEATQRNITWLRGAGVTVLEPDEGPMACGEFGPGRLPEPDAVWRAIAGRLELAPATDAELLHAHEAAEDENKSAGSGLGGLLSSLVKRRPADAAQAPHHADNGGTLLPGKGAARAAPPTDPDALAYDGAAAVLADPLDGQPGFEGEGEIAHRPLYGRHILITAGPTHEPIDPVRYIANRSSGKQGFAIAAAAAELGAQVTLVSGPVALPTPPGVDRVDVETAREMAQAVKAALPADAAIMVAAVADWRSRDVAADKMKKRGSAPPALLLEENPDILATIATGDERPPLVVGFAAETQDVVENATVKRRRKGADWIVANDVSGDVMGGEANTVHIVTEQGVETLPTMHKDQVARELVERVADALDALLGARDG